MSHELLDAADFPADFQKAPTRAQIDRLEREMALLPQEPVVPVHRFAQGLYAREVSLPAGLLAVGALHRQEHLTVLSQGSVIAWTEGGMQEHTAPATWVTQPGTKNLVLALTDAVWTTVHATEERDIEVLESTLVEWPALPAPEEDVWLSSM